METSNNNITILYVEDDEVDLLSVEREFKKTKAPVTIHVAKNGLEALNKLQGANGFKKLEPLPNAILLDINLPKMNGIEFLTTLRSNLEFNSIIVFIVTSTYSTTEKLALQELQVSGCIVKPLQHPDALNILWSITADSESAELLF